MKRDASPGSVHDAGCLGLVRWEGPGGWYGEVGREEGKFKNYLVKKKKKKKKQSHFVFFVIVLETSCVPLAF